MHFIVRHSLLFILIVYLFGASLVLFLRGFLLNRDVLQNRSEKAPNNITNLPGDLKVIILLVDALRFDFIKWQYNEHEKHPVYTNNMVEIHRLLNEQPLNTRLYKFISDPPTTTFQRLRALMTGTLPTFVEIGANFGTFEIEEDNILDQLINDNKYVVFLGDDTWTSLFRGRFLRARASPSLNVWDIDSVDNEVIAGLDKELVKKDWHLLIGHMLGVDHIGHTYGPTHPLMKQKLTQIDTVIRNVIERIDSNTVLLIFGDHGMTESGDHGGSSDAEITSALMIYSQNREIIQLFNEDEQVSQIDLVPTMAQLLNIAIPFSNLGVSILTEGYYAATLMNENIGQVYNFIKEYSEHSEEFKEQMSHIHEEYLTLQDKYKENNPGYVNMTISFVRNIQGLCRKRWVAFNYYLMSLGILSFGMTLIFIILFLASVSRASFEKIFDYEFYALTYCLNMIVIMFTFCLYSIGQVLDVELTICVLTVQITLGIMITNILYNVRNIRSSLVTSLLSSCSLYAIVIFAVSQLAMFSNSYIIYEAYVIHHLLMGSIWFFTHLNYDNYRMDLWERSYFWDPFIYFSTFLTLILKLSTYFWECREEHGPGCIVSKHAPILSIIISSLGLIIFIIISMVYMKRNFVNSRERIHTVRFRYLLSISGILLIFSWVIKFNLEGSSDSCWYYIRWLLIQAVLLGSILVFLATIVRRYFPLISQFSADESVLRQLLPHPFVNTRLINVLFYSVDIMGDIMNSVISLMIFLVAITGEIHALLIILCVTFLGVISRLISLVHDPVQKQWMFILVWSLSCNHWFYATGHQAAFPSIKWNTVELTIGRYGALMVLSETFSSQIIHGFLMPIFSVITIFEFNKREFIFTTHNMFLKCTLSYILVQALKVFTCILVATLHHQHLMVWKIFAPKLVFEVVGFLYSIPFILLGYLFLALTSNFQTNLMFT